MAEQASNKPESPTPTSTSAPPISITQEQFEDHRRRANAGDRAAQETLKKLLDANPLLLQQFGDMARHAERRMIALMSSDEWFTGEAIGRQLSALRKQLVRPADGPLEEMAIHRIVASWLNVQSVEFMCSQAEGDLERAKFWLKRQEQAQEMFNSTLKGLVLIRKFLSPVVPIPNTLPAKAKRGKTGRAKAKNTSAAADSQDMKNGKEKHESCNGKSHPKTAATNGYGINRVAGLTGGNMGVNVVAQPDGQHNHVNRINGHDRADLLQTIAEGAQGE